MKEIWKDIKGYEGRYQVSNLGRVRSLDYTYKQSHGYRTSGGYHFMFLEEYNENLI